MRAPSGFLAIVVALTGCASFPELDAAITASAKTSEFPALIPANSLLDKRNEGRLKATDGAALLARANNLRARGRILRNLQTIDEDTRRRISARLLRLGG